MEVGVFECIVFVQSQYDGTNIDSEQQAMVGAKTKKPNQRMWEEQFQREDGLLQRVREDKKMDCCEMAGD